MKRQILLALAFVCGLSVLAAADCPSVCSDAYLWLDASQTNTMTFSGSEITEWRSVNGGAKAKKYTLTGQYASVTPSGPKIESRNGLVSFGSTAANKDLGFTKSTAIRSVFMVAKIEQSGNAFLLGDSDKDTYDFHRGDAGQYWHSTHGKPKSGKTYFNGVEVSAPTATLMPDHLCLIDVQSDVALAASQLCYDRQGNDDPPRRGGKDIAEVLVFTNALSVAEQQAVRAYLSEKWRLDESPAWEAIPADSTLPQTVSLGDLQAPWKLKAEFTGLTSYDELSIKNKYPHIVDFSDGANSLGLAVNGYENYRELYLTGAFTHTDGIPTKARGNGDVGNGVLWATEGGKMTLEFENDGTYLSVYRNGERVLKSNKNFPNGLVTSVTLGNGITDLGGGTLASLKVVRERTATVVRAHPRLTMGLERESLIGIKLQNGASGSLTNLTVRFDLTNCTPEQISDVRVWRQKYDPVPFAFYERDAVDLTTHGLVGSAVPADRSLTINFVATNATDALTIYPKGEGRGEGDYIWVTAKIADNLATNAEIWTSIDGDRVRLTSGDFALTNQTAKAPHRPFPYKYHIGAYVRQDRLVGNGKTTWDIFSSNTKERFETLTDILPIYSAHDGYSDGKFYVSGWSDGDTASTKRIVEFRDKYNPGCMVRPSLVPNNWVTANGIYGLAFEVAGAAESTRRQFASNIVEFLEAQNCDGLDIDYEWVRDGTNHREWQNIGKLLRELSEQFFDHGFVLSFAGRSHDSSQSGMPYNSADYGAFHTCDFIMSQTYGGGWLNSAPCIQRRGLAVCTSRGLPARRVVLGQAAYVSADGHPGWDGASYKIETFTSDPLRRFDIDTWWKSPYTSYWPFEGMSSLQAQCMWVRRENIGGVMSWGYYTDPTWDGWSGFGRHTSKAVWPMPWSWLAPEVEKAGGGGESAEDVYLLKSEEDWFWLYDHPNVKARFANDITLEHDPIVIDNWTGVIDGDGHKLTFAKDTWVVSEKATGLIRTLNGTVKNLTVEMKGRVFTVAPRWNDQTADPADVRLKNTMTGENSIGVIAAEAGDGAVIENVHVVMGVGSEVKGVKYAGGLVGKVTGAATITNNTVKVGGKLHLEIRNIWDTFFQPSSPAIGGAVGIVASESATVTNNAVTVAEDGEIQDLDAIPEPQSEIAGTWLEPTGWDRAYPRDIDVRSSNYAIEMVLELPDYSEGTIPADHYPQLVNLIGTSKSVALSASGDGGGELFLTGTDSSASYSYPISRTALRGNGDVGSGVKLAPTNHVVTLVVENRNGELRIIQNGETILVTDKNTVSDGYVRSVRIGGGIDNLGGGRIVSLRVKLGRAHAIIHPEGYGKLVFDDEFDGGTINSNHWEKVPDDNRGIDWKKYTSPRDDLYAVSNGCLVLTGAKNDGSVAGDTRKFQCGQVRSNGKFSFKYGMVEIRAKFDNQDGAWPAMWMMPQYSPHGGWPQSGEIDITERLNDEAQVYQTAHFGATDTTTGTTAAIDNGQFNVYGLEWTESKITWYVNGVATHSYANDGSGYLKWPFDSEFFFILSQQLEGSWVGTVDDESTLPVRMYIDYVRVWQKDDTTIQSNAYLWLDAKNESSIVTNGEGEVTSWASSNIFGRVASAYELSDHSPNGPTNANGLVSFGDTAADRDLAFERATDLRTVFMVAKVGQSPNAFLLGDSDKYHFHRGENGEWWSSANASKNITGGRTVWNGETVESPTSDVMPSELGLIEVYATNGVTASQICYDRAGNGSTPRRGGKDVAELVLFKDSLSYTERLKLRKELTDKWGIEHPNWSITDDWVLRRENDFSGGLTPSQAFADGAGTYEFKNVKLTGGLQSSSYTIRVQEGDAVALSGDTLNGRCCLGFDVRGGGVTFPEVSGTWYEHTTFRQTGGTVKSLATSTAQDDTGDGFMLGFNGKTMTLDILGGLFTVPDSSINFYDTVTMNIGGTVHAKGIFRSSSKPATVNVNAGGRLEIGSLGIKASSCALNMKGGTLAAFEDGAAVHDNVNLLSDSVVEVPADMTLTLDGNLYGEGQLSLAGEGTLKLVVAVSADEIVSHTAKAVVRVPDDFPLSRCEIYLSCAEYYAKPQKAESFTVEDGVLYATPPLPDVRASAYLWLDASLTNTMTFSGSEITEWRSVNENGVAAKKYTPSGPVIGADGLVSFGSTTANRDLNFTQSTKIRTVFMVAKVEQSKNAFLLGDVTAYHFHRGNDSQYFHAWNSSEYIRNGKTYWNGTLVESPTTTTMPNTLGLITLETTDGVTASQLCYDRNGGDPRRGGKDIAELMIFEKTLTTDERRGIEDYLIAKWHLSDCATLLVTGSPATYPAVTNAELYGSAPTSNGTFAVVNTMVGGAAVTLAEVPDVKKLDLVCTMKTDLSLPGGGTAAFTIPSGCSVTIGDGGYAGTISAADATSKVRYEGTTAIEWPFADNTAFAGVIEIACPLSTAERQYLFGNKNVVFDSGSVLTVEGLNLGNQGDVTQTLTIRGGAITATGSVAPTSTSGSLIFGHWSSHVNFVLESGTFTALNAATMLGWDGRANVTISGGTMSVKGLLANRVSSSDNDNTSSVTLSGGELSLGEDGIDFTGRGDRNASFTLAGGRLSCREDAAVKVEKGVQVTASSTLVASNATLSVVAPLSGSGDLTLDAPGGTIALYDISNYTGTFTNVTDGTKLYIEVKRTADEIASREPVEVTRLPDNVTDEQCTVKFVNSNTGRRTASTLMLVDGMLVATPEQNNRHLTYTPGADVNELTWDGTDGIFDGETFSDFDSVEFVRVVSATGADRATLAYLPEEIWAGDVAIGGTVRIDGKTLHAKAVTMTNAIFSAASLVADSVAIDTNCTVFADGEWNAALSVSHEATVMAVGGATLALASNDVQFAEGMTFDISGYEVRTSGRHYIVTGFAAAWPTSTALRVVGELPLYKDDAGYFTEKIVNVSVTNGEELVTTGDVYDNLTIEKGGTLVYRGTTMIVADSVTFADGATMALYNADGSKIAYVSGISFNLVTAKTITGTPANTQDFTLSVVSNSDGTKTLKATRNLGSARVIRAHPLLTRGVGKESLIGLDFSGAWGGNVKNVTFRLRLENMTADDIGSFKLWRMPFGTPYAFYESSATDLSSTFNVATEISEDQKTITLTYTATGSGVWMYPEIAGTRDCSDRLWLTAELKHLDGSDGVRALPDDAKIYSDVLTEKFSLDNGSFKVENGIAAAPHRLYPWRYLVTAYMRRDRINANTIGTLQNAPEMRWPSLTHVIVSSFNVQYNWGTDAMQIYWDNNATGAFKRLKEYRDKYHPECRLVPSLTKGSYVSLDSRKTGTAESRYAIAHAGEKKYRAKFVKYLVAKMQEMGADGLDIDWEYPDDNDLDYKSYGLLMRDLAEAFFDHGWDLSMCSNLGYRMPGGEVMAAADYMSSMAYGANRGLHAMNTTSTTAIDVLTSRNVPRRRIVVGQAIYSTAKWHMGWDELAGRCGNDDDIINESWSYNGNSGSFIGFTGPTTYRAKANRVKGVYSDGYEYGGIMSWGYYTDTGWWGGKSLGWNQRQTIWPRPYNFPTPAQDADGTYVITNETGWCWFSENAANVTKVRLAADITFDHDPKPIKSFSGVFDGGNHKLTIPSGIWVVAFEKVGLFQSLTGTIKNLTLDVSGRFICRNDRRNDVQSGWALSAHGGAGASTAALVAEANAGSRIENVNVFLKKGAEVRGNHEVGALVGQVWSSGSPVVISNCTVECFGTVWAKAVDSVNAVISSGTGSVGNGRVGLLAGTVNFDGNSEGVTIVNCSATLRSSGVLQSVVGNNRSYGGLIGNLHVGMNSKFVYRGLSMTYYEGATVSATTSTSNYPYQGQPFFGYWQGQSGSTKPALGTANALTFCGASPSGFDSSMWLTGTPSYMGATESGTAPVVLSSAVTNAVDNLGVMTVSALVNLPSGASGDVILAQCTGGYQFWANVSASGSMHSLTLGYTGSGKRTNCGEVARLVPGVHEFTLALSQTAGTTLCVDGNAVTSQSSYKFSSNPFIEARIGFAGVGLYAYDILPGALAQVRYPKKATYEAANLITFGKDDDPLVISDVTYPTSIASATMKAAINAPDDVAAGPIADWKVAKDSAKYVVEAYRTDENMTRVKWRNDGSTTRNEAAQTANEISNVGTKTLNFIHRVDDNGTTVSLNAQTAVDSPKTHWSGSVITGAAIGFRKGTTLATREFLFGTVQKPDDAHPLDGLAEEPSWYPTMSQTLRDYYRDTIVETLGTYEPPAVTINGQTVTGGESAKVIYLYGGDLYDEQDYTFALDAPVVGEGRVTLGLAGDNPVNAALQLFAGEGLTNWTVAAELPAGSETRSFSLPLDADNGFYQLKAGEAVTTKARNNMPIVSTTISQVNLSEVSAAGQELVVQLEGAGVAEGMTGYIAIDDVAYVAKVDENGEMTFNFSNLSNVSNLSNLQLTLVVPKGAANGDIKVASTTTRALVTEVVADTLKGDGFTEISGFGNYRIPSLVSDGAGEVLCLYDVRYGGGDLGTGDGIDIGETYSADFGETFANPHLAVDVPNTRDEKQVSHGYAKTNDIGDVSTLYDPVTKKYWLMGMTGTGLYQGNYSMNDVVVYTRGKGASEWQPWKNPASNSLDPMEYRSIKETIMTQPGITNSVGSKGYGFLEGPGHGFVTSMDVVYSNDNVECTMPKGTLVFPTQYFVDSSLTATTAGAIYSTDHGTNWVATLRSENTDGPQENCVMELDDGSWYMTAKAGYRNGSNPYAETGKLKFFRSTDYKTWTAVGVYAPVPSQQGSCLRLGKNASDGKGRYVLCHTLDRGGGVRAKLALVFGTDTTAADDAAGISWDFANPLMLYYDNTGFKGYNSLCMVDENTLGVLYEAQGHIYFIRIDVSDRLR